MTSELETLERSGWEALCGPDGAAFYGDVMADDGLMVFPGLVLDRAASLRAIAEASPWITFELTDVREVAMTPDSGVVVYHASARRQGEATYEAEMTSAYARRDGRWQLVLHQQTPTPLRR